MTQAPEEDAFLRALGPRPSDSIASHAIDGLSLMIDEFFGFSHAKSFDADMRAALALREEAACLHPPVWLGYPLHPDANEVA